MKVALELQPCLGQRSGIGIYTYELAKRLQNTETLSFQGNVFNFMGRNDNSASLCGVSMELAENCSMPYGVYRRIWDKVPFSYSKRFPAADITHFFNYIVPPRVDGTVISSIYDMTYLRYPETMDERNLKRIQRDILYSVERSQRIVTISEFSKSEIVSLLQVDPAKIDIVYTNASLHHSCASPEVLWERYGVKAPFILYMGTIEPRKNLSMLIRAFSRFKKETGLPHKLVLAGGKGWKSEDIYATAEGSPVKEDMIFTGYISAEEKNALYQQAATFVFPSLYEGFGMPPLEAMHFDTPVICAEAASLPEVVGDGAVLVPPQDELAWCQAMYDVLSQKELREALVRRGHLRTQRFSWASSAQTLKQIYQQIE